MHPIHSGRLESFPHNTTGAGESAAVSAASWCRGGGDQMLARVTLQIVVQFVFYDSGEFQAGCFALRM